MDALIDSLKDAKFHRVLKLYRLDDPDAPPVVDPTPEEKAQEKVFKAAKPHKAARVEGTPPANYPDLASFSSPASFMYGMGSQEDVTRVIQYLKNLANLQVLPVQKRGSCMYACMQV